MTSINKSNSNDFMWERDNGTNLRGMNDFMSMIIAMILLTNPIAIRNF